ncbi:NAD+ synthase [Falsihalocynthiibacter arcticus]|uniref:Glutamine-dependent NAD(+) synthetase n=1 Tax=Falsihalocynthiibacter arcticus TaxID=1579316 RepID=A0A126UWN1_9RHOB|nr:NAD+ synthase [Falsihalocynthiibacter arcticus]AML50135.1 NAD synthetase [Falsihalocynthiibacter arcticus]
MTFRLTLAQLNPTVGAIAANIQKARDAWEIAREAKAHMLALPEMFAVGYQTQDLVRKPAFYLHAMRAIESLAESCAEGPAIGIGGPYFDGTNLFNAYYILEQGRIAHRVLKSHLPNETVFDEVRIFEPARGNTPYKIGPMTIGSPICEDSWHAGVAESLAAQGAEISLVPNGSPYYRNKFPTRLKHMRARVAATGTPLIYLNMVGGQDDQVFDGGSFTVDAHGKLVDRMPVFSEEIRHIDFVKTDGKWNVAKGQVSEHPDEWEQDYHAMVLSLRDYMSKTGFKKILLGMSGGIDSAIVATIAVDALGPQNVRCVMLPSEYTSQGSLDDAKEAAENLGCHYDFVPIAQGRAAITETLAPLFQGFEAGLAEENIQSRLRGLLLMAMSNKFGEMLLTTGNKSEVAVGYATIYGDMAGGYNPIKDMYKTRVFEQCRWRNAQHRDWMMGPKGAVIPVSIIDKPPSAELRPDQKDEDSLPPYEVLDAILTGLVDKDLSVAEIVAQGHARETVKKVEHLLYISEYKRFQSAPGTRLTKGAFWLDRRYPIVNRWRDEG